MGNKFLEELEQLEPADGVFASSRAEKSYPAPHVGNPGHRGGSRPRRAFPDWMTDDVIDTMIKNGRNSIHSFARAHSGKDSVEIATIVGPGGLFNIDGHNNAVDIPDRIAEQTVHLMHNHPTGTSLSDADIYFLAAHPQALSIEAISADGTIYHLEKKKDWDDRRLAKYMKEYWQWLHSDGYEKKYKARYDSGEDYWQVLRDQTEDTMSQFAEVYKEYFTYTKTSIKTKKAESDMRFTTVVPGEKVWVIDDVLVSDEYLKSIAKGENMHILGKDDPAKKGFKVLLATKEMFPDLLYTKQPPQHEHGGYYAPHYGRPGARGGSAPRDEKPSTVYHGTSAKLVATILQEGITPQQQHNVPSLTYEGKRKDAVFVAEDEVRAKIWSKDAIQNGRLDEIPGENKIRVAVFEISVPGERRHELRTDDQEPNSLLLNDRIPPEWIKGYEIFAYDRKTKRFDSLHRQTLKEDGTYFVPILIVEPAVQKGFEVLLAKEVAYAQQPEHEHGGYYAPHYGRPGEQGGSRPRIAGSVPEKPNPSVAKLVDVDSKEYLLLQKVLKFEDAESKQKLADAGLSAEEAALMIEEARLAAFNDIQTKDKYFKDGKYTEERQALHDQIVDKFLAKASMPEPAEAPMFLISGGLSGSGKSSMLRTAYKKQYDELVIDADEVRKALATADGIAKLRTQGPSYQNEVDDVVFRLVTQVRARGLNATYDGTMKTMDKTISLLKSFKEKGYRTEIAFAKVPLEKAMSRAALRYVAEGDRFVDPYFVAGQDGKNLKTLEAAKSIVDRWRVYSTDVPKDTMPLLLEEGSNR